MFKSLWIGNYFANVIIFFSISEVSDIELLWLRSHICTGVVKGEKEKKNIFNFGVVKERKEKEKNNFSLLS